MTPFQIFKHLKADTQEFIRKALIAALSISVLLIVLHFAAGRTGEHYSWGRDFFNLNREGNFPTWVASITWMFAAVAAGTCYFAELKSRPRKLYSVWLLLAVALAIASLDEVAEVHENLGTIFQEAQTPIVANLMNTYAPDSPWLIIYAPCLLLFGIIFVGFGLQRTAKFSALKFLWLAACACFALAVINEVIQGGPNEIGDSLAGFFHTSRYAFMTVSIVVEESLENFGTALAGITMFAYAMEIAETST